MSNRVDLTGQKFDRLTVLNYVRTIVYKDGKNHVTIWKCQCDCGTILEVRGASLKTGNTRSCGCYHREQASRANVQDLTGQVFGRLEVIKRDTNKKKVYWICKCRCGTIKSIPGAGLRDGTTKSCGCLQKEKVKKMATGRRPSTFKDLTGHTFGRWFVLKFDKIRISKTFWWCRCVCGVERSVDGKCLSNGGSKSCGCLMRELASKRPQKYYGRFWYFIKDGIKIICRSSYEVLYANYLMENGIQFEYEAKTFRLTDNTIYTPDFYLPDSDLYIELKGQWHGRQQEKVELFKKQYNIKVMQFNDVVKECGLKYKSLCTYKVHAKKKNIPVEDYFGQKQY